MSIVVCLCCWGLRLSFRAEFRIRFRVEFRIRFRVAVMNLVIIVMVNKGKGLKNALCMCVILPRVIPLGHWMSVATKTCLSTPFIPDFSILAGSPQSDQYRNLWDTHIITGMSIGDTRVLSYILKTNLPPTQTMDPQQWRLVLWGLCWTELSVWFHWSWPQKWF